MLIGFLLLLGCQLVGEAMRAALGWPVPGPVLGIFVLVVLLGFAGRFATPAIDQGEASLDAAADSLIGYFGLLFVPAGAGILSKADLVSASWFAVVCALVASTAAGLAVTGLTMHLILRVGTWRHARVPGAGRMIGEDVS